MSDKEIKAAATEQERKELIAKIRRNCERLGLTGSSTYSIPQLLEQSPDEALYGMLEFHKDLEERREENRKFHAANAYREERLAELAAQQHAALDTQSE